jgi:hypothetical protein
MRFMTLGGSYLETRLTAALAGSYLVTDIPVRWRMIEDDREYEKVDPQQWAPLAKAFGSRGIKFLDNTDLPDALRVRQEGRLDAFRGWLRRVWQASAADKPYSEASAVQLAAELQGRLDEAESEWAKIDQDSNVGELIGHEATAEHHQALTIRGRFECSVIHDPDQLSADEYVYVELQTRKSSYKTKHPIGPVGPLERDMMVLHEGPEQRRVTLLLANE